MSLIRALFVMNLIAGASQVSSQTLAEPIPGSTKRLSSKPQIQSSASPRPCPEFGPGFYRIEGARSCVKLSGSARAEYGVGIRRGGSASGSSVGAAVQAETRTDTGFGELRTVIRGRGQKDSGLETGPFR